MKARDAVGKRIVKVNQQRFFNSNIGQMDCCVDSLELDDGTILILSAFDTESDIAVSIKAIKKEPRCAVCGYLEKEHINSDLHNFTPEE